VPPWIAVSYPNERRSLRIPPLKPVVPQRVLDLILLLKQRRLDRRRISVDDAAFLDRRELGVDLHVAPAPGRVRLS
jgi:hypothetical protein